MILKTKISILLIFITFQFFAQINADKTASIKSFIDTNTPLNVKPVGIAGDWNLDFSDEFNDATINPLKWVVSVSDRPRGARPNLGVTDWRWVAENAFLNGTGNLVLRGTKVNSSTMRCGSVESRGLYEPTYGYLEARIKVAETAKGNHTAFWLQGRNQGNVDNSGADGAEIDIFESAWVSNNTGVAVHFDGYGTFKKNYGFSYNALNIHNGYHVFGLLWTPTFLEVYYDGVKVVSKNASRSSTITVDTNGYPVVPKVPEWLWLSVGASFGDGDFQSQVVGTLSDALVDYVRVFKSATPLGINETNFKENFKIYPNPAQNTVTIESEAEDISVKVYDINGKLVFNTKKLLNKTLDVSSFEKGTYIFKLLSNEILLSVQKIVLE
jgi:Glycosyl hydrolases family 16/Secretion system C-terminal sorting domain